MKLLDYHLVCVSGRLPGCRTPGCSLKYVIYEVRNTSGGYCVRHFLENLLPVIVTKVTRCWMCQEMDMEDFVTIDIYCCRKCWPRKRFSPQGKISARDWRDQIERWRAKTVHESCLLAAIEEERDDLLMLETVSG